MLHYPFLSGALINSFEIFRGEDESNDSPFRAWYGKLGEVRSLITCPILLMTATSNRAARKKMIQKFSMINCMEIIHNPDRENIKLFVQKFKSTRPLSETFRFLLEEVSEKKQLCNRYVIFCPSIKACSEVYTMFRLEVNSCMEHVNMYHSKTTDTVKEAVKDDMSREDGAIRILIATSAAGMGVNLKGVNNVINFGPPKDMDTFVQQFGRAGRDGSTAMAILIYNGRQCRNLDSDMKEYVLNTDKCRRMLLLSAYNAHPLEARVRHLCCDICSVDCSCGNENCSKYNHPYCSFEEDSSSSEDEIFFSDSEFE